MRSTLFIILLVGAVAVVLALPHAQDNPVPGEVYVNTETGERIVIDVVWVQATRLPHATANTIAT